MTKDEFDKLVSIVTDPKCYERIEFVYMNCDDFETKQQIADFYKEHDMNGIEKIYHTLIGREVKTEEFKQFITDLAIFAEFYVEKIRIRLVENMMDIYKDKTIVLLLHQYASRLEQERKHLLDDFWWNVRNAENRGIQFNNNCLTDAKAFRKVLSKLLIED